jgi:hypothetical protein
MEGGKRKFVNEYVLELHADKYQRIDYRRAVKICVCRVVVAVGV